MKRMLCILGFFAISYGQSLELYTDANPKLAMSWQGQGTLTESATSGFEGSRCFKFDYTTVNWWSGFYLVPSSGQLDLRTYQNLTIACKVSNPGYLMEISVKLVWANTGTNSVRTAKVYAWDFWESHTIPLSTWSTDSVMNNIVGIQIDLIGRGATGTVWFDDIKATGPVTPPIELDGPSRIIASQDGLTQWGDYAYAACVWGAVGAWTQQLTAFCDTNQSWRVSWNFDPNTGVQSYPYCGMTAVTKPEMVYQLKSRRATFATWVIDSIESTGSGINASFDIFTCATPYQSTWKTELMIWYQVHGDYPFQDMLPKVTQAAAGYAIAGQTWSIYHATFGADSLGNGGWNYIAFVATENIKTLGKFDINQFFDFAVSIGRADPNDYVTYIAAGTEICGGTGKLRVSKYKVEWDGSTTPVYLGKFNAPAARKPYAWPRVMVLCRETPASDNRIILQNPSSLFDIKGRAVSSIDAGKMKSGILLVR